MVTNSNRFHGSREIRQLLRQGKPHNTIGISLRSGTINGSRLAVVVSKKVHKHAVVRNLIRRRLSALVKDLRKSENLTSDLVIIVKDQAIASENFSLLKQRISKALNSSN